jgi:hypothetical protein
MTPRYLSVYLSSLYVLVTNHIMGNKLIPPPPLSRDFPAVFSNWMSKSRHCLNTTWLASRLISAFYPPPLPPPPNQASGPLLSLCCVFCPFSTSYSLFKLCFVFCLFYTSYSLYSIISYCFWPLLHIYSLFYLGFVFVTLLHFLLSLLYLCFVFAPLKHPTLALIFVQFFPLLHFLLSLSALYCFLPL